MCSEISDHTLRVCDVALADVRAALTGVPEVTITHIPFEGNDVSCADPAALPVFKTLIDAALAPHGGSWPSRS